MATPPSSPTYGGSPTPSEWEEAGRQCDISYSQLRAERRRTGEEDTSMYSISDGAGELQVDDVNEAEEDTLDNEQPEVFFDAEEGEELS